MTPDIARRTIQAAYELGWSNACADHLTQRNNPEHPIGACKRTAVDQILNDLDPGDLLGLRQGVIR